MAPCGSPRRVAGAAVPTTVPRSMTAAGVSAGGRRTCGLRALRRTLASNGEEASASETCTSGGRVPRRASPSRKALIRFAATSAGYWLSESPKCGRAGQRGPGDFSAVRRNALRLVLLARVRSPRSLVHTREGARPDTPAGHRRKPAAERGAGVERWPTLHVHRQRRPRRVGADLLGATVRSVPTHGKRKRRAWCRRRSDEMADPAKDDRDDTSGRCAQRAARGARGGPRLRRPAEAGGFGAWRQRARRQGASRVVLVVGARRHVVGRVGVKQRGEQLDLPAAHA